MKAAILLIGLLAIKLSEGRPEGFTIKNEVHKMTQELVQPLLDKTKEADETLARAWKAYNEKMSLLDKKISVFKEGGVRGDGSTEAPVTTLAPITSPAPITTPNPNSCKELKESMDAAQKISNDAAVLVVQVMADLTDIVITSGDCLTINIFKATSCSAHKLKDARDTYNKYKPQMSEIEQKLSESLKSVGREFVGCFHRVN